MQEKYYIVAIIILIVLMFLMTVIYVYKLQHSWPKFVDPVYYVNTYPDLKAAFGTDQNAAMVHYLAYGINENRTPYPHFVPAEYVKKNPGTEKLSPPALLQHYLSHRSIFAM